MFWRTQTSYSGRHALVTGGSTGIGLALARELVQRGAHVTLVARTQSKLDAAVAELRALADDHSLSVHVKAIAADTCSAKEVQAAIERAGHIDVLICSAGVSYPGRFLEQSLDTFESTMDVNYFGTLRVLKAALPSMVGRREGEVVLISSAAAVCGFAGFTSYAPSKAALRSLADALRNELLPSGVRVSIAYPPDTDTPGYANENLMKPPECHAISRAAGDVLYTPQQVAKCIMRGMERRAYHLPGPDLGQNLMLAASAGLSPHMYNGLLEFLLAPIMVIVLRIFGGIVDRAVRQHAAMQQQQQ